MYIRVCEEHFNNLINFLCNGKVPWMLKDLYGIIDANKKTFIFKSIYWNVYRNVQKMTYTQNEKNNMNESVKVSDW